MPSCHRRSTATKSFHPRLSGWRCLVTRTQTQLSLLKFCELLAASVPKQGRPRFHLRARLSLEKLWPNFSNICKGYSMKTGHTYSLFCASSEIVSPPPNCSNHDLKTRTPDSRSKALADTFKPVSVDLRLTPSSTGEVGHPVTRQKKNKNKKTVFQNVSGRSIDTKQSTYKKFQAMTRKT